MAPRRLLLGLSTSLCASLSLAACDSGPSPLLQPLRPGADQSAVATKGLPPATARAYDAGIAPENEERGLKVGELVKGAGGQHAQKDADRKAQAEHEAKQAREREELARQQGADQRATTK